MAFSMASIRAGQPKHPPRIIVYGPHGIGKTTYCASAPKPIVMQTEDGLGILDTPTFGLVKSMAEVNEVIGVLLNEPHDYQTFIVDSLDWLEPMIWAQACADNKWKNLEDAGFGKGYIAAIDYWREFLSGLNALRDERGMTICMIAHADVKRFDSPETEPYDRYQIKLHPRASAICQENADCVFFANYRISTIKSDAGFNKKVVRGVSGGDRIIYTSERPAFLAKNRYSMPDSIPMEWDAFAEHVPFLAPDSTPTA